MTYTNAKKLHSGDKVIVKDTGKVLTVVRVYSPAPTNIIYRKNMMVECNDGSTYHHTSINLLG